MFHVPFVGNEVWVLVKGGEVPDLCPSFRGRWIKGANEPNEAIPHEVPLLDALEASNLIGVRLEVAHQVDVSPLR
jgi:hypothetical protein